MQRAEPLRRGGGDAPTHPGLLGRPLDFIGEDHLRERQICAVIDAVAQAERLDRQATLTVLRFLNEELNVHLRDEAETLFPLLARRCKPEDCIENAISRIRVDQDAALRLLPEVRAILAGCLDAGSDLSPGGRAILTRLAGHVRRHLVAENAILLPIARARLTRADLAMLAAQMRARRGLPLKAEAGHAE
ncbi:MAG: hemerythrin domain-containing protein [Tabrizicola sp.]|jgi:iron-sulfur cluster repair protein YtfE (RIC family)|nr:hemerythrin domain-containing protein [Tabrizicola sp.]